MKQIIFGLIILLQFNFGFAQSEYEIVYWRTRNANTQKKIKIDTEILKYNELGQLIEMRNGKQQTIYKYKNGLLTDSLNYSNDKFISGKKYYYNEERQKIKECKIGSSENMMTSSTFSYDDNGLLKTEYYQTYNHKYDCKEKGTFYFYDNEKRLIKKIDSVLSYNLKSSKETILYKYTLEDEDQLVIEYRLINSKKNKLRKIKTSTYNPNGVLIFEIDHSMKIKKRFEYQYDEGGNWIVKRVFQKESWPSEPILISEAIKTKIK